MVEVREKHLEEEALFLLGGNLLKVSKLEKLQVFKSIRSSNLAQQAAFIEIDENFTADTIRV